MEVTTGMKITVRKAVTPLTLALTRMARARASPDWQGTTTRAKSAVLARDRMKDESPVNARMKLFRPTKLGGRGEMRRALVKDRRNVSRMGMPMKSSRRMSAGEDMSQAWRASLRSADWRPLRLSVDMVVFPSRQGGAPPDRMDRSWVEPGYSGR